LKPKHASRRYFRVSGSDFSHVQYILFALEENDLHRCSKAVIPVWCPTLIGLDLSLTSLIDIIGKRKKILTYTQETTRAKLERLCLARLINHDQTTTTRHAKALSKAKTS
jgi:hypothetical protein